VPDPYPYQREGITFLRDARRAILADEMGLGKTPQALLAVAEADAFPMLVVAPKAALGVWVDESAKWLDMKAALYVGQGRELRKDDPIVVTTYGSFPEILRKRAWRTTVYDESHKLRNRKTRTLFLPATKTPSPFLFELTGTPIVSEIDDLWAQLHLIDPVKWKSYWNFVKRYMFTEQDYMGHWQRFGEQNVAELRRRTHGVLLRRLAKNVAPERPPLIRQSVPLELIGLQKKAYDQMVDDMLITYGDNWVAAPTEISRLTKLRQLLLTPLLLDLPDEGAIFRALRETFEDTPHPAVIFMPFTKAMPMLQQYLKGIMECRIITGQSTASSLDQTVKWFANSTTPRRAIIATTSMGTSWSATASWNVWFAGFSWSATDHEQAEKRLDRHGQTSHVLARYFIHRGAADETVMMPIIDRKMTSRMVALDPSLLRRR
jgi:SWI/SNF-related matrix-associated actin-dependent regulator 1 of chromatin subfamily A